MSRFSSTSLGDYGFSRLLEADLWFLVEALAAMLKRLGKPALRLELPSSYALIFAVFVLLLPFTALAADGKADAPVHTWRTRLHTGPPMPENAFRFLKVALAAATPEQKAEAARYIFDNWSPKYQSEVHEVMGAMNLSLGDMVAEWAQKDLENVFRRLEVREGFGEDTLRTALVRGIARRSPLEAARFMSDRLNPMSKQYYYYVTIYGLVPSLVNLPMSEIMPALAAMASGHDSLDDFRWCDAISALIHDEISWKSPDLDADWQFLVAQKPGILRDILLGLVLQRKLVQDLPNAIKIDLTPTRARLGYVQQSLWEGFPLDHPLFLKHLPEGDFFLMERWVERFIDRGRLSQFPDAAPKWSDWAAQVLAMKPDEKRDAALAFFTRLRLKYDEFSARQWSATLQDTRAKAITEREVQVSEIIHQGAEDWPRACDDACALTSPSHRQRALLGLFKAGVNVEQEEAEARAKAATSDAKESERLLDFWAMGRIEAASKAERYTEVMPLVLTLRDPDLRMQKFEENAYVGRFGGFAKLRQSIIDSKLGAEEKRAMLDQVAIDQTDGLMDGFHVPEELRGPKAAIEAAALIEDPRLRFIHQRAVVHDAMMSDVLEARGAIESATIDATTRARLMKEWDRVSQWYQPEPGNR